MAERCRHSCVLAIAVALVLLAGPAGAQTVDAPRCGTGVHESEASGSVGFPARSDLLSADRRPERSPIVRQLPPRHVPLARRSERRGHLNRLGRPRRYVRLVSHRRPRPRRRLSARCDGRHLRAVRSRCAIQRSDQCGLCPRLAADVSKTRLQLSSEAVSPELASRRRVPAAQRRHRSGESLVRVDRVPRVSGNQCVPRLRRRRTDLPTRARRAAGLLFHTGIEMRSGRARKVQLLAAVDVKTTERTTGRRRSAGGPAWNWGGRARRDIRAASSCCCSRSIRDRRRTGSSFRTTFRTLDSASTLVSDREAPQNNSTLTNPNIQSLRKCERFMQITR